MPELKPNPDPLSWRQIPPATEPTLVALGNFDGVHLGHQRILDELVDRGRSLGLKPIVVTFEPPPRYYFRPDSPPRLLTTRSEKQGLLRNRPLETLCLAFDRELAEMDAEVFVRDFLQGRLNCRGLHLGHDHRFGRGARGNAALLREVFPDGGHAVHVAEAYRLDGEIVSSSAIRAHLEAGDVQRPRAMLGRPYACLGKVVAGDGRGRQLGFPTANLEPESPHKLLPAHGVYAGLIELEGREYASAVNIGVAPTFAAQKAKLEAHVLDFGRDIYGQTAVVKLLFRLRSEEKFTDVSALKNQMRLDIDRCRTLLTRTRTEEKARDSKFSLQD